MFSGKNQKKDRCIDAVLRGNLEEVLAVLDAGADVDVVDKDKRNPLIHATIDKNWTCFILVDTHALSESTELQDFLIHSGANENLKNHHDVSPKDLRDG